MNAHTSPCHVRPAPPRRIGASVLVWATLVLGGWGLPSAFAQLADDPSLTLSERRELTLQWLDRYLTESDLLRPTDMAKIREAVLQMAPSQLEQWLAETKDLRAYVESEKWQATRRWLREFLRVQAMYSDAEIQQLRDQIVRADAAQMLAILKRIQSKHDSLMWMHDAAEKSRQIAVMSRDENHALQQAQAAAMRESRRTDTQLFGSSSAGADNAARNRQGFQPFGALVNSRELAVMSTWREAWGPAWFIGGF
ncbi:MAG: hypothetical protein MUF48_03005 [Pirellulaceae bacterium]|nr:hypothetical protein [Pirellulaceae bacterium]